MTYAPLLLKNIVNCVVNLANGRSDGPANLNRVPKHAAVKSRQSKSIGRYGGEQKCCELHCAGDAIKSQMWYNAFQRRNADNFRAAEETNVESDWRCG